jgi:hypothetical protein
MLPIFGSANPVGLGVIEDYRFWGFILASPSNDQIFINQINSQYKNWHIDTGKEFVICTFFPPPKVWMERYSEWWMNRYRTTTVMSEDAILVSDILQENNYKIDKIFYRDFVSVISDAFQKYEFQQNNIASAFGLNERDFPAFIVFDNLNDSVITHRNVDTLLISSIISYVTDQKVLPIQDSIKLNPDHKKLLLGAISNSNESFHHSFTESSYMIIARRASKEKAASNIRELTGKFPQFANLKKPENFSWSKTLLKCLEYHSTLVESYIKQLNFIADESLNHPSLDLKIISNPKIMNQESIWRFRVNEKFRALFFYQNDKRVHFFLGDHDKGLK